MGRCASRCAGVGRRSMLMSLLILYIYTWPLTSVIYWNDHVANVAHFIIFKWINKNKINVNVRYSTSYYIGIWQRSYEFSSSLYKRGWIVFMSQLWLTSVLSCDPNYVDYANYIKVLIIVCSYKIKLICLTTTQTSLEWITRRLHFYLWLCGFSLCIQHWIYVEFKF